VELEKHKSPVCNSNGRQSDLSGVLEPEKLSDVTPISYILENGMHPISGSEFMTTVWKLSHSMNIFCTDDKEKRGNARLILMISHQGFMFCDYHCITSWMCIIKQ
jgi:hypothetical protein